MASATATVNSSGKNAHGLNSLTLRLMGVNILALLVIGIGILQTGQFRTAVITTELTSLETEIKLISTSLSDQAERVEHLKELNPYLRNLSEANNRSILLYDTSSLPIGFARVNNSAIHPNTSELSSLEDIVNKISLILPIEYKFPIYKDNTSVPHLAPNRIQALKGQITVSAWQSPDGRLIFSAGAPIKRNGQIIGSIVLIKDETQTEAAMLQTRVDMARTLLAIFVITAIMLIYFAAVVGRPLNKLVDAAEKISRSRNRSVEIPDLSYRNDEIGTLSSAFRDMTSALWTRMDSIEHFAADVSHELKNPLTSMRSAIETLERVKTEDQKKQLISILSHDIRRMDRLITDISRASRIDAELSRENLGAIDLEKLFINTRNALQSHIQDRAITLDLIHNGKGPFIALGVEGRLAQVFENIIINALSFTLPASQILVTLTREEHSILISFNDQGPGIPPGKEEKIFERFYSERPSQEKFGEHSGLGLAICRQVISSCGGKIWAENITDDSGRVLGASFIILLRDAS